MTDDLSPAETAIKETKTVAKAIYDSFLTSRKDVHDVIPVHDKENNTIEKFVRNFIPYESWYGHHLRGLLPADEFSCDEETLCEETFYHASLDFLSIMKPHLGIIVHLDLECENSHCEEDHHKKLQNFIKHKIPDLETGLERFRNDHNLSPRTTPERNLRRKLPEVPEVKKAYYIAIIHHLDVFTTGMENLYEKLPKEQRYLAGRRCRMDLQLLDA